MDDDWLDTSAPNQGGAADPLTSREYDRLASRYSDAGYREGITDGKLSTLQEGFDQSFSASVEAARRLGNLRGRAAALLAYHTSQQSQQSHQTPTSTAATSHIEKLRDLLRTLNGVKRDDILPKDLEREIHEKEEHADGDGFELDINEQREMEGLENALAGIGNEESKEGGKMREAELLDHLESSLARIENGLRAARSA